MSKYVKLTFYLAGLDAGIWETTFEEVEQVLGFSLPASARQHQAWWANQMRSQSLSWQGAGWKTASVDLATERLTFIYAGGDDSEEDATRASGLTISDAKLGLAAMFGVKPEQVEITIRA
jgi:hypothetical protein